MSPSFHDYRHGISLILGNFGRSMDGDYGISFSFMVERKDITRGDRRELFDGFLVGIHQHPYSVSKKGPLDYIVLSTRNLTSCLPVALGIIILNQNTCFSLI